MYEYVFVFNYVPCISADALRVAIILLLLLQLLLHAAAVRHRVQDCINVLLWFIASDSSVFCLHSKIIYF